MREQDGAALVGSVERRVWLLVVLANLAGAVIAVLFAVAGSVAYPGGVTREHFLVQLAIGASGSYVLVLVTSRALVVRRRLRPAVGWLLEGRPATDPEREALAAQARRQSTGFLVYWFAFVVVVYPYAHFLIRYRPAPLAFIKAFIFIALSVFFSWTLAYVFVERAVRPLVRRALAGERTVPKTLGIFPRLLLAWAAAAGFPLVAIAIEVAGLNSRQLALSVRVIVTITIASLLVGIVATFVGARAFSVPLERLRLALGRVAAGNLHTDIAVEDAGEIGELQVGFNEMIAGIRERDVLRDLLGRHVGDDVAKISIGVGGSTRAERRDVSTVFVDVIGSSTLTMTRTPDDVVASLNAFFDVVVRAIDDEGGLINKFEGDGVLGVFGAPSQQDDHALRALRAARTIRARIEEAGGTIRLDAAVGVATGNAIAGNVGAAERYEYTVIGDPVSHAMTLCDEAKHVEGRVLATRETVERAPDERVNWEDHLGDLIADEAAMLSVSRPVAYS